ncbi:glycosyltransferase family 8 protein [Boletus reticuloceps]|uniref:Glycosyltransferase family 8 protein n=1 Tax=Boletus reticuloceps TaxID=495285 RepID=A0A8I3AEY7_9AGAM|nr:glycosyltransferase family 8 protein [Boletus reticuloceps]
MAIRYAFVTLLTSDAYLPGALTVAAALKGVHRHLPLDQTVEYETVCLVTPETVDVTAIRLLRKAFNVVIGVEVIVPPDAESLTLLGARSSLASSATHAPRKGVIELFKFRVDHQFSRPRRPDLDTALTKLHVFRLAQYSKVVFLDADVLPLRPLTHLFHLEHELSAVPDVGWPDIFNSGVMVLSPGEDKFKELQELLHTKGTWDGADQGLLNEWRGSNWNRLSFTYNTTPTAIYTYAPAFQRFGSQISVVHFIGPQKPWHSLPYRAPGSSAQSTNMVVESSTEPPSAQQRAYDYGSLVDRWYNVYDEHYRSQATEPIFQPSRYTSAWNEKDGRHARAAGGALGLEELRRVALEGMGTSGVSVPRAYGEGDYRTMPLEGRFDLICPRTRAERKQAQAEAPKDSTEMPESAPVLAEPSITTPEPSTPLGQVLSLPLGSPVRWMTLPTPEIHEIPPAPHARLISLPPTPLRYVPAPYKLLRNTRESGAQTISIPSQQPELGRTDLPLTPLKNPAIEATHNVATPAPMDAYFPKEWDVDRTSISSSSSDTSLTTMEPSPSKPRQSLNEVFSSSLMSATPEILRRRGPYRNITRAENGSPTPDPAKMRCIFPWEERSRQAPRRVFPDEGSPLIALSHLPVPATPERKTTFRSPMPSPLVGFPPSLLSQYPQDSPFPQKYAGGVPLSAPSPSPLGLGNELDTEETSSQDGDVEDEVDSEEETQMRPRMRSSSIGMAKRTRKYRSIGVQTDPRDLREEGIQVTTFVPAREVAEKLILMNKRLGRNWVTSAGSSVHPATAATYVSTSPLLSPLTPTKLVSAEVGEPSLSSASSPSINSSIAPPSPTGGPPSFILAKDPAYGIQLEVSNHLSEDPKRFSPS